MSKRSLTVTVTAAADAHSVEVEHQQQLEDEVSQPRHVITPSVVPPLLLLCLRVLGLAVSVSVSVRRRMAPAAEDPEGGDEGERHEAGQRGGVQRQRHRGLAAEAAEVGAHLAPRHLPVAAARQLQQLRRRRGRRHQQVRRRLHPPATRAYACTSDVSQVPFGTQGRISV